MEHKNELNSRWANIAHQYDIHRLSPPAELIVWLAKMSCGDNKPELVVDLGCGTGLSTRPWASFAHKVIGIDPSDELLAVANSQNQSDHISYMKGFGSDTGLKDQSVDIVTAMHSIHWMEPVETISEVIRVLKVGGTFLIYAHTWPPISLFIELDNEFFKFHQNIKKLIKQNNLEEGVHLFMPEFSKFIIEAKYFDFFREFYYSENISWAAEDYIEWIYTLGNVQKLLKDVRLSEEKTGLARFAEVIKRFFKSEEHPLLVSWRVFLFKNPLR